MKGFMEEITWTALLLIFVVIVIVVAVILTIAMQFFNNPVSFSVEFVGMTNKPYVVSDVITHYKIKDRQSLEYMIDTAVTSKELSAVFGNSIKDLLDRYGFIYYSFSVKSSKGYSKELDKIPQKCGDNEEGACTNGMAYANFPCGVGAKLMNWNCAWPDTKCCAENVDVRGNYIATPNPENIIVVNCGPDKKGVCDFLCARNFRFKLETDECKGKNNGWTEACCMPLSTVPTKPPECKQENVNKYYCIGKDLYYCVYDESAGVYVQKSSESFNTETDCRTRCSDYYKDECLTPYSQVTGIAAAGFSATTPLLYKGKILYEPKKYYCIGEFDDCPGEAVGGGLCEPGYKCCVTDVIFCKGNENYACRTSGVCNSIGGPTTGTCPQNTDLVCCNAPLPSYGDYRTKPDIKGICNLGNDFITGESVSGSMVVGIGA